MNNMLHLAYRLSAWLLRLHPLADVSDFVEEMQTVQTLVLEEAETRGAIAAWTLVLREMLGLIGVILRSWMFGKKAAVGHLMIPETHYLPTSWRPALLSLLPFLVIGPLSLSLSYLQVWIPPDWGLYISPVEAVIAIIIFWGGILLGSKQGFPRWSYPYVMVGVISLSALVNELLAHTLLNNEQFLWILVIAAVWTLVTYRWSLFSPFYAHIRQDWTHLSYCFFTLIMLLSAGVDHEETPALTLQVLLPSILTLAGAFLHLRSATQRGRIGSLLSSTTLGLIIWSWPFLGPLFNGRAYSGWSTYLPFFAIYVVLICVLLVPAVLWVIFWSSDGVDPVG